MLSLPMEVVVPRVRVLPPVAPGVGLAARRRPLDRRREVADHRVEPDVDPLVRRARRSPATGIRTPQSRSRVIGRGLSSSSRLEREVADVRPPVVLRLDPLAQRGPANAGRSRKRWFVSRNSGVVPSIFERGSIRSIGSSWLPQLSHWSPRASVIAADRARALDVAVGERVAGRRRRTPRASSARRRSPSRTAS